MNITTVKLYTYRLRLDGLDYCGQIPARSWQEAQENVGKFGGVVDGELVAEMSSAICAMCKGDIVKDLTNPQPLPEEWPDEIDL